MTLTVGNATANNTEAAISRTVAAGSTVIIGVMDWNATNPPAKTPLAGSGTATERRDASNGTNYSQWLAEWANTGGVTANFGPNNYTSLKVAQAIAVVASSVGATSVSQFAEVGNWFATAAASITGVAWAAGDAIVVVSGSEHNASTAPPTPTNANLTFTSVTSIGTPGDANESGINIRYAIAAGAQTGQTISLTDPGVNMGGAALWVIHESSGGITGTVAVTLGSFVSAASGTATPPAITGTVAVTLGNFTSNASGTYTPPPITGTVARTLAPFVSAASGTVTAPGVSGSVAVTLAPFVASATGTATPPAITGTVAVTLAPFISTASGTVAGPGNITGTVAVTLGSFTSNASGTSTPPAITGTVARTLGLFVAAGSGTVAGPGAITGSATITLNPFTSTATGTAGIPAITGTVAVTLGPFVSVAFDVPPALSLERRSKVRGEVRVAAVAAEDRITAVRAVDRVAEVAGEVRVRRVRADIRVAVEA